MIAMFLNFGEIPDGVAPILESKEKQEFWSNVLLVTSVLCVPTMLLVKPLILKKEIDAEAHHQSSMRKNYDVDQFDEEEAMVLKSKEEREREREVEEIGGHMDLVALLRGKNAHHDFAEIFIH